MMSASGIHRFARCRPKPLALSLLDGSLPNCWNVVEGSEYLVRNQMAVEQMHGCRAEYSATVSLQERFPSQTIWIGEVEDFDLDGRPKTMRCLHGHVPAGMQIIGSEL